MNRTNYNNVATHQINSMKSSNTNIIEQTNPNEILNFKEILQLFNCAISQEQAWAVLYQVLNEFKILLDSNLELIKLNQDNIDINILYFTKDGSILFGFQYEVINHKQKNSASSSASSLSSNIEQEKNALETKILKSVAYLIYDALDYGNNYSNEPVLESSLSHLLLLTSGHYKEFSKSRVLSEDDEGYDQDEEDTITLEKAIEICINNVAEADYHYKAVCRGLYAQAYELKAFLAKIEDSKNILQKSGKDTTNYCFEVLDKTDWAKLWMQVIHELRHGVKLRKVSELYINRRNIEYELTPFEILLDQIRAKRYHLKKVSVDTLNNELKKDARDIILEFIRSRPPLKKTSLRNLNNTKIKNEPLNLHEQLMNSIRNYSTPLRKISTQVKNNVNLYKYNDESLNKSSVDNKKKRLLKPDKKLLNNLTSSDDDDSDIDYEEIKNLPILEEEYMNQSYLNNTSSNYPSNINNSINNHLKRKIKAPESLKSPLAPWRDPVENWRALVTEDVVIDNLKSTNQANMPNRRHTMNIADIHSISNNLSSLNIFSGFGASNRKQIKVSDNWEIAKSRLSTPIYFKSGPGYDDSCGFVSNQELVKKLASGIDSLKLTFEELCHIRNVLTKAELDYLLFDNQLFQDVSKGRVCFSCRKTKFHLFNWGCKCRICQQRVCKKCLRNAQLKNGHVAQVPLFKLCPTKFQDKLEVSINKESQKDINSHNSNSSMSSQMTNDESDHHIMISSNEKVLYDSEQINITKDNYLISMTKSLPSNSNNIKILDICVDCYQMMDGVSVSINESSNIESKCNEDKGCFLNPYFVNHLKNQVNNNDEEDMENENNDSNNSNNVTFSGSTCNSPDSIKMNSLININNVDTISCKIVSLNNESNIKTNNGSMTTPLVNKILPITSTCHSTPTPTAQNLNLEAGYSNNLSKINIHENIDYGLISNSSNSKSNPSKSRQHLTLDLQPVYTTKSP